MVKNLSCVSCGSLKRFPHTFTNGSLCEEKICTKIAQNRDRKLATFLFIFEPIFAFSGCSNLEGWSQMLSCCPQKSGQPKNSYKNQDHVLFM